MQLFPVIPAIQAMICQLLLIQVFLPGLFCSFTCSVPCEQGSPSTRGAGTADRTGLGWFGCLQSHCFSKALLPIPVFTHGNTSTICPQASFHRKVKCEDVKGKKKNSVLPEPSCKHEDGGAGEGRGGCEGPGLQQGSSTAGARQFQSRQCPCFPLVWTGWPCR